jgi:hypothetical protein
MKNLRSFIVKWRKLSAVPDDRVHTVPTTSSVDDWSTMRAITSRYVLEPFAGSWEDRVLSFIYQLPIAGLLDSCARTTMP